MSNEKRDPARDAAEAASEQALAELANTIAAMEPCTPAWAKEVYRGLEWPWPRDAIQHTDTKDTFKGYNTTGIAYQYVVDRLNLLVGLGGWRDRIRVVKVDEYQNAKGKTMFDAVVKVRIAIGMTVLDPTSPKGSRFVEWAHHEQHGGHSSSVEADALKGGATNAMKKCAAMLGCGASAYRGTLDDDNIPLPAPPGDRVRPGQQPAKQGQAVQREARKGQETPARTADNPVRETKPAKTPPPDPEMAELVAKMKALAEKLGKEAAAEVTKGVARDTMGGRRTMVRLLEEALRKRDGIPRTVDGFWLIASEADFNEEDAYGWLDEAFGKRKPEDLTEAELSQACQRLAAIAEKNNPPG